MYKTKLNIKLNTNINRVLTSIINFNSFSCDSLTFELHLLDWCTRVVTFLTLTITLLNLSF